MQYKVLAHKKGEPILVQHENGQYGFLTKEHGFMPVPAYKQKSLSVKGLYKDVSKHNVYVNPDTLDKVKESFDNI